MSADKYTVAGVYDFIPNDSRKWWQFWKPKWVIGELTVFTRNPIFEKLNHDANR